MEQAFCLVPYYTTPVLLFVGLTCVIVLIRCDERQGGDGAECALGDCGWTTANSSFDLCAMSPSRTAIANDRVWLDNPRDLTLDTRQQRHETSEGHHGVGSCRVVSGRVVSGGLCRSRSGDRVAGLLVRSSASLPSARSIDWITGEPDRIGQIGILFIYVHLFSSILGPLSTPESIAFAARWR